MILPVGLFIKIGQTVWPLIKELFTGENQRKWLSENRLTIFVTITIIGLILVNAYLREQASNNLYLQQPLIAKINALRDQNTYLQGQVSSLQNDVLDSEDRVKRLRLECPTCTGDDTTAYSAQTQKTHIPASMPVNANAITAE